MYVIGKTRNGKLDYVYAQVFWSLKDAEFARESMGRDTVILEMLTPNRTEEREAIDR